LLLLLDRAPSARTPLSLHDALPIYPRADQDLRAQVREPAGNRRRCVDHARHLGPHQRLGRHPVQVERIQDRDLTRSDAPQQPLSVAVHPRHTGDTRQRLGRAGEEAIELHESIVTHVAAVTGPPRRGAPRPPSPVQVSLALSSAATFSSSSACARPVSVPSIPASMRASSATRSSSDRVWTSLDVTPPEVPLRTAR